MFKKETDLSIFTGMKVTRGLPEKGGPIGYIGGLFGKTGKFKVDFPQGGLIQGRQSGATSNNSLDSKKDGHDQPQTEAKIEPNSEPEPSPAPEPEPEPDEAKETKKQVVVAEERGDGRAVAELSCPTADWKFTMRSGAPRAVIGRASKTNKAENPCATYVVRLSISATD